MTERRGWDVHDHYNREKARNKNDSVHFTRLRRLRNAMAHGTEPEDGEVRDALQSEAKLGQFLGPTFKALLDDDGAWNAGP
jgi:hypothetical protein